MTTAVGLWLCLRTKLGSESQFGQFDGGNQGGVRRIGGGVVVVVATEVTGRRLGPRRTSGRVGVGVVVLTQARGIAGGGDRRLFCQSFRLEVVVVHEIKD